MKKVTFLLLGFCLLLGGCSSKDSVSAAMQMIYESYYEAIQQNEVFESESLYYTLSTEMTALPDGTYRYYIVLDDAQVAMYDVVMMTVENDIPYVDATKMMPSIGIFDDTDYNLIPNQSNPEAGYVKGLVISGESSDDQITIKMLVEWNDRTRENTVREYIGFVISQEGMTPLEAQGEA